MSEKEFRPGEVYWSGTNPPKSGSVPEGYQWQQVENRYGTPVGGHKLVSTPDPEGPSHFVVPPELGGSGTPTQRMLPTPPVEKP